MKLGGAIEDRVRVLTRLFGLLAPPFMAMYGYLVALGYAPSTHYVGAGWLIALTSVWIVYGIWQYFWPPKWQALPAITLAVYHVLGALFLLTIAGFTTFVMCGWAILALITYLYFSSTGYAISLAVLGVSAVIDMIVGPALIIDTATTLLNMIGVVFVSGASVGISYAYRHQSRTLRTTNTVAQSSDHQRLLTIINNLADAVLTTDANGTVELYNAATLGLLDTNADIAGRSIDEVLAVRDDESNPVRLSQRLHKLKHVSRDDSMLYGDLDDAQRMEVVYAPIRGSYSEASSTGSEGYIVIARDITKAKTLEEERDEFISVVSHELRTPVTIAEGTISNAQALVARGKDSKQNVSTALDEAHDQVMFLANMINDLSTLSRAERGVAGDAEPINVADFVHDLYNEYVAEAEKQKLHFNLELSPGTTDVFASRLYLHELLQNFITNALKYTKEGTVTLAVKPSGSTVVFTVRDTGIGISKADQAKIFTKFYRSEDYRTRETSGTGLGLYVAAKLAKKLGTDIEVKSRLNHGSSFTIRIPQDS